MRALLAAVLVAPWCSPALGADPPATAPVVVEVDGERWQRVPLVAAEGVCEVALLVRPSASPADARFVGFELVNRTGGPLEVDNADFRLEGESDANGSRLYIVSGNPYDLVHRDVTVIDGPRAPLPPGASLRLDASSNRALHALGVRDAPLRVSGRARLDVSFKDKAGSRASTPCEGVPFAFEWRPPDEAGRARMRERVRALVRDADANNRDYPALLTLLADPSTAAAVTVDDVLAGLRARPGDSNGRAAVAKFAGGRFANDSRVSDAYVEGVADRAARNQWLRDLAYAATDVTDPRLVEPLMAILREDDLGSVLDWTLIALQRHAPLARDPKATVAEIGRITLANCPTLAADKSPWPRNRNGQAIPEGVRSQWAREAERLARARDPALAPRLRPYLDDRTVVWRARDLAAANNGVDSRACDLAYNALHDLLNRPGERFGMFWTARAGEAAARVELDPAAEHARRDALIGRLRGELDGKGG